MLRENLGDSMIVLSSINDAALARGTCGLFLNSFSILSEPALLQIGPRLKPCSTPPVDSAASNKHSYIYFKAEF